ncbi:PAS domain-containing protein [Sphingopyxis sp. KK2]|uniref:PAS domain-containing protein n=1 Tax=Sphingopyxis sp. KK2 TaxID=1855727 RepID=UPI00097E71F8|nr:PAS domain-containing protein [Sphingopyxis sp. KK2]
MGSMDGAFREIFPGDSEMARQMRAHDWSATSLGDPATWPDALKIPLHMLLTSRFEMWLGWGDDLAFFYNDAYIPTLGIKHPSMLGRPFREVWAEVYDDVADQVERVRAGEATWNKALLLLLERSGYPEETYHSFSYSPLGEGAGKVGGLLCIVSEETERIISERRLETLRHLGTSLVGAADVPSVIAAVRAVFTENRRDFPFAELRLDADGGRLHRCDGETTVASLPSREAPGRIFALDAGTSWPSGDWDIAPRDALVVNIPGAADKPPLGSLGFGLNPYRRADDELIEFANLIAAQVGGALASVATLDTERQRADRMWTHARDLMVAVNAEGVFVSASPAWSRILGHDSGDVIGHHFEEFVHPDDLEGTRAALGQAMNTGDLTGFENRFRTKGGDLRWISWHTAMEDGLVFGYGRDISEQKRGAEQLALAEDALRQAQKMEAVGQLTGGVAHDFNNLLMAIHSSLELLARRTEDDPQIAKLVDNSLKAAERGAALTQRMLAFARRQELVTEDVALEPLVAGMMDLLGRSLGPSFEIRTDFPGDLPAVRADVNQLEMALLNLVVNARDAMPAGGIIVISAAATTPDRAALPELAAGDHIRLTVEDRGPGMDAETLARAADPFFTTKGIGKGTGLGLSMVHGFARQLGGALQLESRPGEGTRAHIWLAPGSACPRPPQAAASAASPSGRRHVVLAVDDDAIILMNTAALLEDLGHEVLEAASGDEALELLEARPDIDLLITDQAMPGMTGSELIAAVQAGRPDLPVILATGYGETPATNGLDIQRLGKPYGQSDLRMAIEAIVS